MNARRSGWRVAHRAMAPGAAAMLVWTGLVILPGGGALAFEQGAPVATSQDPLPDGPEKETFEMVCGVCHEVDTAIGTRRTAADWQLVIDAMINRGALASEDEFKQILAYLTRHFVVVNVNKAEATEIAKVLELSAAQAEAIVRHRGEHGPFASLDDVKKVDGLDANAIEKQKLRVAFK